jgi:hypothetical protein
MATAYVLDRVDVVEEAVDGLSRVSYHFWKDPYDGFVVDRYMVETRPSKRHGWKCEVAYTRLFPRAPNSTITAEEVPLTAAVIAKARAALHMVVTEVPFRIARK